AGDKEKAYAVLEELKTLSSERYIPPSNVGLVHNALGNESEALSALEKACDERDPRVTLLKVDPRWDSLRDSPRFVAILRRIALLVRHFRSGSDNLRLDWLRSLTGCSWRICKCNPPRHSLGYVHFHHPRRPNLVWLWLGDATARDWFSLNFSLPVARRSAISE